ncbi:rod shape-determining protein MreC [Patescibacteria group bacterium]|nr:rod shape-determining protein MreC [Patescibacteria group bacterium]
MVYLSKNNKKNNFIKNGFIFIFFFLLILLFIYGKLSFLNKPLNFVVKPLSSFKTNSTNWVRDFIYFLDSKKDLVEENKLLREKIIKNELALVNKKILLEENSSLKNLLGMVDSDSKLILANIILKPGLSIYNSLILDVGTNNGINIGDRVFAGDIIIGEIEEVFNKSSKAKLYSFPKDKIEVVVGFNKILTIAEGKGDGVFEIRLPKGTNIEKGDVVTLSDESLNVLGIVEDIVINPEDPFETILFKSPVNVFELRWVQIKQE